MNEIMEKIRSLETGKSLMVEKFIYYIFHDIDKLTYTNTGDPNYGFYFNRDIRLVYFVLKSDPVIKNILRIAFKIFGIEFDYNSVLLFKNKKAVDKFVAFFSQYTFRV